LITDDAKNKPNQKSSPSRSVAGRMLLKLSNNGAYKILVAQKDTITKITGTITPKSLDTLENKLGGAFTILKSTHFDEGQ
jgi:hypothetical protein